MTSSSAKQCLLVTASLEETLAEKPTQHQVDDTIPSRSRLLRISALQGGRRKTVHGGVFRKPRSQHSCERSTQEVILYKKPHESFEGK